MKGMTAWVLLTLGVGTALQAADRPEEERLVIVVEKPDDTTTIRIPLSWMEMALDVVKVLDREGADTSSVRINWDSLKAALTSFRGGFLEARGESERVYLYVGTPELRCPCLEMTGKNRQERERVLVNLAVAQNVLRHGEIEGLSAEERERLLKFLEDPRLGEAMEIVNTKGDTVLLRIVGTPGKP